MHTHIHTYTHRKNIPEKQMQLYLSQRKFTVDPVVRWKQHKKRSGKGMGGIRPLVSELVFYALPLDKFPNGLCNPISILNGVQFIRLELAR